MVTGSAEVLLTLSIRVASGDKGAVIKRHWASICGKTCLLYVGFFSHRNGKFLQSHFSNLSPGKKNTNCWFPLKALWGFEIWGPVWIPSDGRSSASQPETPTIPVDSGKEECASLGLFMFFFPGAPARCSPPHTTLHFPHDHPRVDTVPWRQIPDSGLTDSVMEGTLIITHFTGVTSASR